MSTSTPAPSSPAPRFTAAPTPMSARRSATETSPHVEPRLDFFKHGPDAMKAMAGLEAHVGRSGLERPLVELVRLRASQINGCAYCICVHTSAARKAGESERRLATVAVWREMTFFSPRERAALEWTESLTRVAETHVPEDVWA